MAVQTPPVAWLFPAGVARLRIVDKVCHRAQPPRMATMNISLPDQMKAWVESRSADGKYANSSDYVRDLIRREQIKAEKIAHMQKLIDEAYASGFSDRTPEEIFEEARQEALNRAASRAA
jgi:antitoxin ParD1/3/4